MSAVAVIERIDGHYNTDDGKPEEEGVARMLAAMWQQIHKELGQTAEQDARQPKSYMRSGATWAWVLGHDEAEGAGFRYHCAMAHQRPDDVRATLIERYPHSYRRYMDEHTACEGAIEAAFTVAESAA